MLGVAYKKDISDMRESPALKLIQLLRQQGALVSYHDPFVPELPDFLPESAELPTSGSSRSSSSPRTTTVSRSSPTTPQIDYEDVVERAQPGRRFPQRNQGAGAPRRKGLEAIVAADRKHAQLDRLIGGRGLGYWGPNLARNFDLLTDLRWICDASPELLEKQAKRYPQARRPRASRICSRTPSSTP